MQSADKRSKESQGHFREWNTAISVSLNTHSQYIAMRKRCKSSDGRTDGRTHPKGKKRYSDAEKHVYEKVCPSLGPSVRYAFPFSATSEVFLSYYQSRRYAPTISHTKSIKSYDRKRMSKKETKTTVAPPFMSRQSRQSR